MDNVLYPDVSSVLIDTVDNSEVQILVLREVVESLRDTG